MNTATDTIIKLIFDRRAKKAVTDLKPVQMIFSGMSKDAFLNGSTWLFLEDALGSYVNYIIDIEISEDGGDTFKSYAYEVMRKFIDANLNVEYDPEQDLVIIEPMSLLDNLSLSDNDDAHDALRVAEEDAFLAFKVSQED